MSESDIVEKVSLSLRGSPYELSVCARLNTENPSLAIAIEHVPTGNCWKGDFAADYIHNLTTKTGNFKRFNIFIEMLVSAIKSHLSSSKTKAVVLDLLSAKDLEALRNNVPLQQASPPPTAEKLYLILTYAVAFDRVHYPLPLTPTLPSNPHTLKVVIAQIQSENTRLNNHVQKLTEEKRVAEDMVSKLKFEANNQIEELQNEFKKVLSRVQEGKVTSNHFTLHLNHLQGLMQTLLQELRLEKAHLQTGIEERDVLVQKLRTEIILLKRTSQPLSTNRSISNSSRLNNPSPSQRRGGSVTRQSSVEQSTERPYKPLKSRPLSASPANSRPSLWSRNASTPTIPRNQAASSPLRSPRASYRAESPKPSPNSNSFRRFDPTAYIVEREARRKEEERSRSNVRRARSSSNSRQRSTSREFGKPLREVSRDRPIRPPSGPGYRTPDKYSRGVDSTYIRSTDLKGLSKGLAAKEYEGLANSASVSRSVGSGELKRNNVGGPESRASVSSDSDRLTNLNRSKEAVEHSGSAAISKGREAPVNLDKKEKQSLELSIEDIDGRLAALQKFLKEARDN